MAMTRSEQASAARLRRAREAGQGPLLFDLRLLLWALSLWLWGRYLGSDALVRLTGLMRDGLKDAAAAPLGGLTVAVSALLVTLGPGLLLVFLFALAPGLWSGRPGPRLLGPHLRNPFSSLWSESSLLELGMGVARISLFLLLSLQVVAMLGPAFRSFALFEDAERLLQAAAWIYGGLTERLLLALLVLLPLGLWAERALHRRALRMTVEERKRERLLEEVDPRMRAELRRRAGADAFATTHAPTHALLDGRTLHLLWIGEGPDDAPVLVERLRGAVARARLRNADHDLLRLQVPQVARQLRQLVPGDRVPRACYPALSHAVAAQRARGPACKSPP